MRAYSIPMLALALTLTGCFPRLANYGDAPPPPRAQVPGPGPTAFAPQDDLPFERIQAFIMIKNPYLPTEDARALAEGIRRHAREKRVPVNLVVSLVATESSFDPRAVSPVGAQGLGQLMPATAKELGVTDPFDPDQNLHGTTRYLAWLARLWEGHPRLWELVLASYLAGIGTVKKQEAVGAPLTAQQAAYVRKILIMSGKVG